MKLKLSTVFSVLVTLSLLGCAPTPNDVTLTSMPGVCVTSSFPGYESQTSSYSKAFPMNANMPESSPYCMAYTITNNNTGENSNNIQVYQGGLQLNYTVESIVIPSLTMWDFNAAGFYPGYYYSQTVGGLTLFDPNNCVTTYGSNVKTLNKNGGQCTFYLQVTSESMPIGDYPVTLSVNYTNGNDNYYVTDTFNYHVDMVAGGDFTSPGKYLARYNGNSEGVALPLLFDDSMMSESVQLLARDAIGNIYAYDGESIYKFGIESKLVALPKISTPMPIVNQLKGDSSGNLFAATNNGVFVYKPYTGSNSSWIPVTGDITGDIVAIQMESTVLYYSSNQPNLSQVESCLYTISSSGVSCTTSSIIFESTGWAANNKALAYNGYENSLWFGATEDSLSNVYSSSTTYLPESNGKMVQFGTIGADSLGYMYAASYESSVSYAVFGNSTVLNMMSPIQDESGGYLYGKAKGTNLRSFTLISASYMNLFVYGDLLCSIINPNCGHIAYLPMVVGTNSYGSSIFVANDVWSYIKGFNENSTVNEVVVYSHLSNN